MYGFVHDVNSKQARCLLVVRERKLLETVWPSFSFTEGLGVPTSIDFVRTETSQMVASYSSANCVIYDLETATAVVRLDSAKTYSKIIIFVTVMTIKITITQHELC